MAELLDIISQEQVDRLYALFDAMDKVDSKLSGLNKSVTSAAEKTKGLNDIQKEAEKLAKDQASAMSSLEKQRQKAYEQAAKQEAKERELADAMTMQVKSIEDARKQNDALAKARNKVNLTTEDGRKKAEAYNKIIDKNTEFIRKNADAETKRWMNVGKYKEALMGLPGPLGRATSGVAGLGKQLWALVMNPIVAIVAAIVLAFTALYKILSSTDAGANFLQATFKSISAIFDVVKQRVLVLVDGFKALFSGNFREAGEKFKESVSGIGEQMKNAAKEAWNLVYAMDALEDAMRANISKAADYENRIAKLRVLAKDQTKSDKERMDAAKEAMDLQRELADDQIKFATEQYDLDLRDAARKVNLSKETVDALVKMDAEQFAQAVENNEDYRRIANELGDEGVQKLEESYAKMIGADTAYFEGIRRQQSEYTGFVKEMETARLEAVKVAAEEKAAAEQAEKERREGNLVGRMETIQLETDAEIEGIRAREAVEVETYMERMKRLEEERQAKLKVLQEYTQQAQAIGQTLLDFNQFLIDTETQKMEQAKAYELSLAGDNAEKREAIEKKYDKEATKLKIKQAKQDKAQALFGAIIKTAQAILAGLAYGPPLGYIFAALNAVLGGIQIGVIASQPIPQFAKGTRKAPRGPAWLGERGKELIFGPDGSVSLSPSTATLVNLKGGERIIPNRETEMLIRAAKGADDERSLKVLNEIRDGNNKIVEAIKNKPVFVINKNPGRIDSRPGFENYLKNKLG